MNHVLSIARKELRAYFHSPIALIFLATFLVATLFTFFWVETFFSRNLADVRPLFSWLPILLVFLVSALTMRLWSEEQKLGTLEILLTLPVRTHQLVLGKFLGGLSLVALALFLTLGIPVTVSMMGDLDVGPVIGGYFGALLLASAYLSIGLFISSLTENQIIALIFTALAGAVLYALGSDPVTSLVGNEGGELLRSLGSGSRFESIRRGVIDLRDVLYYLSLTALFLLLNTVALEAKRWSDGARTRSLRTNTKIFAFLVGANLVALCVWMAPLPYFRADLTERSEYSVSDVTEKIIGSLESPLLIRGYFSSKTHPLLAPLVPQIRDLIQEYSVLSSNVRVEFVDPQSNDEVEREANQAYGIKSFPFRVASRYEDAVVNSYFSILVKYGDQYEVLNFSELIEVKASQSNVEVKLRNLEYDLTRTIKKVAFGFQTLEAVFADLSEPVEFFGYITPAQLPENFKQAPERIEKVLTDLQARSSGKFKFSIVDPDAPGAAVTRETLYQKFGFKPMAVSLFSEDSFYLHLLVKVGDRYERIMPAGEMSEADVQKEIVAAVKRSTPGFLKTIGLVKPPVPETPPDPRFGAAPQEENVTQMVTEQLGTNYTTRDLDLKDGRVPGDIDALVLLGPKSLDAKQRFAIDQYLMRGGAVLVFSGRYELDTNSAAQNQALAVRSVDSGLGDLLGAYGVTIQDSLVLDPQNEAFPVPVVRELGGMKLREIQLMPYPFFVDVRSSGMSEDNPAVAGLPAVTLQWASPLAVSKPPEVEGKPVREVAELLSSSAGAWTQSETNVQPDFRAHPEAGFAPSGEQGRKVLAVAVRGKFESAFKDQPSPLFGEGEAVPAGQTADRTGRTIKESPETARLVVVGSNSFFSDVVLGISRQTGGDRFTTNLQLVENLVDWGVADTELLSIRSRGTFARTLEPMDAATRKNWEYLNYGIVLFGLGAVVALSWGRRRRMRAMHLQTQRTAVSGHTSEAR